MPALPRWAGMMVSRSRRPTWDTASWCLLAPMLLSYALAARSSCARPHIGAGFRDISVMRRVATCGSKALVTVIPAAGTRSLPGYLGYGFGREMHVTRTWLERQGFGRVRL